MAVKNPAPPASTSYREPPAIFRRLQTFWTPGDFKGDQWRALVGRAPVVRSCVSTLIMMLGSLEWSLEGEDQDAVDYFTEVLEGAENGDGFEVYQSRIAEDCMVLPFGGAAEHGIFPNGVVAWTAHIDAATLVPTYDPVAPYAQVDPWQAGRAPVAFNEDQIGRVRWQAETRLKSYGWTKTPAGDALPAIQALLRADAFWQSFLSDGPPAGILDLMDMTEDEARSWYEGWKTLQQGIDAFKIPVLYGGGEERKQPAHFIEFNKTPQELSMMEIIKTYAEWVTACFGMSLGDLGLFGQELRLAGAIKIVDLTSRQGLSKLMRAFKAMIDMSILPAGVTFKWKAIDTDDSVKKASAANMRATSIATLSNPMNPIISVEEARQAAIFYEIIPEEAINKAAEQEQTLASGTVSQNDQTSEGDQPQGSDVQDQLEGRAGPINSFPAKSKWAKRMAAVATKLLAPAKRGATKARIVDLIEVGIRAWEKGERSYWPDPRQPLTSRAREDARQALDAALGRAGWYQAPDLLEEVSSILQGAYEEGLGVAIGDIESERLALGLDAISVDTTVINIVDKRVLDAIRARGGQLISGLDDTTKRYIVNAILNGVQQGVSSPEIARNILADDVQRTLIEQWKNRTQSIVNTEINWAESSAALQQQRAIGLTKKRWIAIPGLACDICQENMDLGPVDQDYEYDTAIDPSPHPPGHPGVCHCYVTIDRSELEALGNDVTYWLGGGESRSKPAKVVEDRPAPVPTPPVIVNVQVDRAGGAVKKTVDRDPDGRIVRVIEEPVGEAD